MTKHTPEDEIREQTAIVGGQLLIPAQGLLPTEKPTSELEREADLDREDEGLLDTDSPEFDHSLRRRKRD